MLALSALLLCLWPDPIDNLEAQLLRSVTSISFHILWAINALYSSMVVLQFFSSVLITENFGYSDS